MSKEILHIKVGTNERPAAQIDIDLAENIIKTTLEKLQNNNFVIFATHHAVEIEKIINNSILLIRVGNDERPASIKDIEEISCQIKKVIEESKSNIFPIVTHHSFEIDRMQI